MKHSLQLRAVGAARGRKLAATLAILVMTVLAQGAVAQTFSAPDIDVTEGNDAVFNVKLPTTYSVNVRWFYETVEGTATAYDDYAHTWVGSYLTIAAGSRTGSVTIGTSRDDVDDDEETFKLKLSAFQTQGVGSSAWASAQLSGVPTETTITATIWE